VLLLLLLQPLPGCCNDDCKDGGARNQLLSVLESGTGADARDRRVNDHPLTSSCRCHLIVTSTVTGPLLSSHPCFIDAGADICWLV